MVANILPSLLSLVSLSKLSIVESALNHEDITNIHINYYQTIRSQLPDLYPSDLSYHYETAQAYVPTPFCPGTTGVTNDPWDGNVCEPCTVFRIEFLDTKGTTKSVCADCKFLVENSDIRNFPDATQNPRADPAEHRFAENTQVDFSNPDYDYRSATDDLIQIDLVSLFTERNIAIGGFIGLKRTMLPYREGSGMSIAYQNCHCMKAGTKTGWFYKIE